MADLQRPALVALAGRPGVGKTAISRLLGTRLRAAVVRVDTVEAAIVRSGLAQYPIGPVGYAVAIEVASTSLAAGTSVVIDAVNPVAAARTSWHAVAKSAGATLVMAEVVLADAVEHRRRVETRDSDVDGLMVPTWTAVQTCDYDEWDEQRDGARVIVDGGDTAAAADAIVSAIVIKFPHTTLQHRRTP